MFEMSRRAVLAGLSVLPVAGCVATPPEIPPIDYGMILDGGIPVPAVPANEVPERLRRQVVPYETDLRAGSVVILRDQRVLYLVLRRGFALRYSVAIGRDALAWSGEAVVARRAVWPEPAPTAGAPDLMAPMGVPDVEGPVVPSRPLGARALYLANAAGEEIGLSIHGSPTGGAAQGFENSGFRLINQEMIDLYDRVEDGARVVIR
ncbi:L,D-transpeptidase [Pararhodobacter sp.]